MPRCGLIGCRPAVGFPARSSSPMPYGSSSAAGDGGVARTGSRITRAMQPSAGARRDEWSSSRGEAVPATRRQTVGGRPLYASHNSASPADQVLVAGSALAIARKEGPRRVSRRCRRRGTSRVSRLAKTRCGATRESRLAIASARVLGAMMPWPLVARTPRRTVHARLLDRGSVRWNATTGRRALRLSGRSDSPQPEPSR